MMAIGLGAGIGALCRYQVTIWVKHYCSRWPLATLLINLVGAFILSLLSARAAGFAGGSAITTGFLGGLTTFSTMNVEAVGLLNERRWGAGAAYLLLSYGGGLLLAALGLSLGC